MASCDRRASPAMPCHGSYVLVGDKLSLTLTRISGCAGSAMMAKAFSWIVATQQRVVYSMDRDVERGVGVEERDVVGPRRKFAE